MKNINLLFVVFAFSLFPVYGTSLEGELDLPLDTLVYNDMFNNRIYSQFDSDGNLHVFYSGLVGSDASTRDIYYANNVSGEFEITQITETNRGENYPVFALDKNDVIHLVYISTDDEGYWRVVYHNNLEGDFSDPVYLTQSYSNVALPYMDVDIEGIVHFVFSSNNDDPVPNYIYYNWYDPWEEELGSPLLLGQSNPSGENEARIGIDPDNHIHIVYRNQNLSNGFLKYFNNTSGDLEEVTHNEAGQISYPELLINEDGSVYLVYRLLADGRLYFMQYQQEEFSDPVPMIPPESGNPMNYRFSDFDDNGNLFLAYTNSSSANDAPRGYFLVHGKPNNLSEPALVWDIDPDVYVLRNNIGVTARGNGEIAIFFGAGGVRNSVVVSDIFFKKGIIYDQDPEITVTPASLNFELVNTGETVSKEITIGNAGFSELIIEQMDIDHADFWHEASVPFSIDPGESETIEISFSPGEVGEYEGVMTINSNATNDPSVEVGLYGEGVESAPIISFSKEEIFFEDFEPGVPATETIGIINTGNIDLEVSDYSIDSDISHWFSLHPSTPYLIEPGDTLNIEVTCNVDEVVDFENPELVFHNNSVNQPDAGIPIIIDIVTGIGNMMGEEKEFQVMIYPNPVNPASSLEIYSPEPGVVQMELFDAVGRKLWSGETNYVQPGQWSDASELIREITSAAMDGINFLVLKQGNYSKTLKLIRNNP